MIYFEKDQEKQVRKKLKVRKEVFNSTIEKKMIKILETDLSAQPTAA